MTRYSKLRGMHAASILLVLSTTAGLASGSDGSSRQEVPSSESLACNNLENGSFDNRLTGWTLDSHSGGFGAVSFSADAMICDLTSVGRDQKSLCMNVSTRLDDVGASSSGNVAQAAVTLSRRMRITNQFLKFDMGASYGGAIFGLPSGRITGRVVVTGATGRFLVTTLIDDQIAGSTNGDSGTGEDAVAPEGPMRVDLLSGGFEIGQEVLVEIVWSLTMASVDPGKGGAFGGTLMVDNFRLCDSPALSSLKSIRRASYIVESRADIDTYSLALLPPLDQMWIALERISAAEQARALLLATAPDFGEVNQ